MLYLFRWVALFCGAMLTLLISAHVKRMETAYIAACGALLLPSLLYLYVGLDPLRYLSLALPIEGMALLLPTSGILTSCGMVLAMLLALCILSVYLLCKRMKIQTKKKKQPFGYSFD